MTSIDLLGLARERPIHFMGICGAGMAPLAELILRSGGRVTGCDARRTRGVEVLERAGAIVTVGHDPGHIEGCSALVVTAAVRPDHPEILAAQTAGIPVVKRAEALGAIAGRGTTVAIAGTHGKTTTTALTTAVLTAAGLDPTGIVGGTVSDWGGNLRVGDGTLFVVEADEYDRSFLALQPEVAVITTMEADHLDIFGSLSGVEDAFLEFVRKVPSNGLVVACGDDSGVGRLLPRLGSPRRPLKTYGTSPGAMLRAEEIRQRPEGTSFLVREGGRELGWAHLRLHGLHNVRNALAAIAIARHFDAPWAEIATGLESYGGVDRRFERIGEARGVLVIDDYAHHPTEIAATLEGARSAHPGRRIVAVFQPHLYSRTRDFASGFGQALARADLVFVADIYPARETPIAGVTGELIVAAAHAAGADVRYLPDRDSLPDDVVAALKGGDLCITLGAGDLDEAARDILARLEAR